MAEVVVVDGPALIRVNTGSEGALETLGYTRDGVQISEQVYTEDVPGDQNGGTSGPPIDIQYFGEFHIVRLELTKWDPTVDAKVASRRLGGTLGTTGTAGSLYSGDSLFFRLLIQPTNRPRNYVAAIPRD